MEACREKTENALAVLEAAMNDESASWRDRMTAASLLIDHGHGKPIDRTAILNLPPADGGDSDGSDLTTAQLRRIAAGGGVTRLPPAES